MENFLPSEQTFTNPFFIGTVENNVDPTNNYRVKVRIKGLHPANISVANLPWAAKVDSAFMGFSSTAPMNHAVPEIGSQVLLVAVGNDPNALLYIGILCHQTPMTPLEEIKDALSAYDNTYGMYMSNGQFIGVDKVQKIFNMIYEGDINIDKADNLIINIGSKVTITAPDIEINSRSINIKGNVNLSGNVSIEGYPDVGAHGDTKIAGDLTVLKTGSVMFKKYATSGTVTDTGEGAVGGSITAAYGVVTNITPPGS